MDVSKTWDPKLLPRQQEDASPPPSYSEGLVTPEILNEEDAVNDEESESSSDEESEDPSDEESENSLDEESRSSSNEESESPSNEEGIKAKVDAKVQMILEQFNTPYNSARERPPKLTAYHPSFAKVESLCTEISRDAATIFETSEYKDRHTQNLLDTINRLQEIKYGEPKRIGIVGDSGVGNYTLSSPVFSKY